MDKALVGDTEGTLDIVLKYFDQGLTLNIHPDDTNQPYLRQERNGGYEISRPCFMYHLFSYYMPCVEGNTIFNMHDKTLLRVITPKDWLVVCSGKRHTGKSKRNSKKGGAFLDLSALTRRDKDA